MSAKRWSGRVDRPGRCAVTGCTEPGEFRAPLTPGDFDGPGTWQLLCLEHVRAHNARYNFFAGMSADEIEAAQSPIAGWDRRVRAFAYDNDVDPAPAWRDFKDPLDAIAARYRAGTMRQRPDRFTAREREALRVLRLDDDTDLHAVRKRYSELVRQYHPDRNGGDRSHEAQLGKVIEAWQLLKVARAFAA